MIIVKLFMLLFVENTHMMKLARVLIALALFIATTGVTVTSIACAKESGKTPPDGPHCMKSGKNVDKSCCVITVKRFSVKSEFAKPMQPASVIPAILFAMRSGPAMIFSADLASHSSVSYTALPRTSVEECALISTFRI